MAGHVESPFSRRIIGGEGDVVRVDRSADGRDELAFTLEERAARQ